MAAAIPLQAAEEARERLRTIIRQRSLLTDGSFRLASGRQSGLFFDMKRTMFDAEGAALIGEVVWQRIRHVSVDALGGLVMGAVPIVAVVCARSFPERPIQGFFVRKEAKDHGTAKLVDGNLAAGARAVVVEDVTTTGGSAMQAAAAVRAAGAEVVKVITIVDRLEGAAQAFAAVSLPFEAIFERSDFL